MKKLSLTASSVIAFSLMAVMVTGCKEKETNHEKANITTTTKTASNETKNNIIPAEKTVVSNNVLTLPPCDQKNKLSFDDKLVCLAQAEWSKKHKGRTVSPQFFNAFRQGIIAASQVIQKPDYPVDKASADEKTGFQAGFDHAIQSMGTLHHNCTLSEDTMSEYHKAWCKIEKKYSQSHKEKYFDNPVLADRFMSGVFSGQTIVTLTPSILQTAIKQKYSSQPVDNLIQQSNIIPKPATNASPAEKAFYSGFIDGASSMVKKITASISQINNKLKSDAAE